MEEPMGEEVSFLPPFLSTRFAVRLLGGMFLLTAAVSWLAVGVDFAQLQLAAQLAKEGEIDRTTWLAHWLSEQVVNAVQLACMGLTALAFLFWLYRVRVNVRALGMRKLRYRREWTLLSFLVPILNLLRPYQVVREIWQASDPQSGGPVGWKAVRTPRFLAYWWLLLLAYLGLEVLAWLLFDAAAPLATRRTSYAIGLLADGSAAVSASLAYFVVSGITDAQDAKHAAWGRADPNASVAFDPRDSAN
ncbi:MAG: DUF4328 domain-containing protein [Myxococcales bacterium]|nr:DUF4328 domain-containing protein [Myxococcales bacterium]